MIKNFNNFINENLNDFNLMFKKTLHKLNSVIEQAKKDNILGDKIYKFDKVEIDGNIFRVYYKDFSKINDNDKNSKILNIYNKAKKNSRFRFKLGRKI